ncbi:DUF5908 family protein [Flavobacterium adhaerens]|uniref:DUF5908 family protein n=1 Tax=Flavobacterium adhaerens TaxID=3149043 RepID=UPI0032B42432
MPIEIKELHIKINVNEGSSSNNSNSKKDTKSKDKDIIAQCVETVMQTIERQKER